MSIEKLRPSFTFNEDRIEQLKSIAPEAFADDKINWSVLKEALGEQLETDEQDREHFGLNWPGKRIARRLASTPSEGSLSPSYDGVEIDGTHNVLIEGDNLEVLKLLQKSYAGQIKMIYIDPPYNTGNDFVYPDDYSEPLEEYLRKTGQLGERREALSTNTKADGRFHSNWLNMMYPRLRLARQLLKEDGVIFVSIDDNELHHLRILMNEVFGEQNFVDTIIWKRRYGGGAKEKHLVTVHEYVLFYAKNIDFLDSLFVPVGDEFVEKYYKSKDDKYEIRGPYRTQPLEAAKSMGERKNLVYSVTAPDGSEIWPKYQWLWSKERSLNASQNGELEFSNNNGSWSVNIKQYLKDENGQLRSTKVFSIIDDVYSQHGSREVVELLGDAQIFPFPKPIGLIKPLLQIITNPTENDIVLDFFAGSGTTAHAVLEINREDEGNRQFILVQFPEPTPEGSAAQRAGFQYISDITKERVRKAITAMKNDTQDQLPFEDIDMGFRAFRLSKSNFRKWFNYDGQSVAQLQAQLDMFETPLVDDWAVDDLLFEVMLIQGFPLDSRVSALDGFSENNVLLVESDLHVHRLFICLDEQLSPVTINHLVLNIEDVFACLDSALTDTDKMRLADACNLRVI